MPLPFGRPYTGRMDWLIYPACGALAGLIAGLFGVGGGLIVVPVLASLFDWQGLAPASTMHLALGTSLFSMIATSLSSTVSHHRHGGVDWRQFSRLAPGIVLGSWIGAGLADRLGSTELRQGFGVAAMLLGLSLWRRRAAAPPLPGALPDRPGTQSLAGLGIGSVSALAGIGGGTLTVPYLLRRGLPMVRAAGTSAACGLPIALFGSASYLYWGWNQAGLPPQSWGYLYWPAALGLLLGSVPCAPLGAALAHRLPARALKRGFAVLLLLLGAKMLFF